MLFLSLGLLAAPALSAPPEMDPALESKLDDYITLFEQPADERAALLAAVIEELDGETPTATRVRARGYYMLDFLSQEDEDAARQESRELVSLAEDDGHPDVIAEALAFRADVMWRLDDNDEAMTQIPLLERILPEVHSPRVRYYAHNLSGRLLRAHSQYEDALSHFLAAYDAVQETDDERTQIRRQFLNYSIAQMQAELRNYDQALRMVRRGIRETQDLDYRIYLPEFFLLKGYIFAQMEDKEASIQAHEEAIDWAEELERPDIIVTSLNNIGSAQIQMENFEDARETLQRALAMAIDLEDEHTRPLLEFNLAYLAIMLGEVDDAIEEMEAAHSRLAEFYSDANMADLLGYMAEAYNEAGLMEETIETLKKQRELKSRVFQAERDQSLSELQTRYETREQATQIELLEERNELQERVIENSRLQQRITILFVIVVIMSLILLWQAYRAARRANLRLTVANKQLEYQSVHDTLTGLLNRRSFQKEMQQRGDGGKERRAQLHPDALLLLDVDFFKRINDQYGHSGGDVVLRELAGRLKAISRSSDMVIRWGGEEILMFLRNMDPAALPDYVARVLEAIGKDPIEVHGAMLTVTATGGFIQLPFAGIPEQEINWEKALNIADMALYLGKTHGRNRAIGILGVNRPFEEIRDALSNDLANAVDQGLVDHTTVKGPPRQSPPS
ncbi:tetratricopeptide repeat-containing diguanylate cyclase [Gammaproteobacteria bacterium AB-CW1]|uniref:diguanylate cyclase n=1 Tax=Natronospira elongata TaxID=3110268 RepID=A0AAP6JIN7_9GAMM|nr:tetratricopeptide repeat-containing diguanylate cyclase [Gammaproteobacteria bacterium AB-CW1]MEA5446294.1 tetratricopeptide repeat-containing diguanylate cyclase [Gammaproteobacteria bacterium AB-CW1]